MAMNEVILLPLITLALAIFLIHRLQAAAWRLHILDTPGGHKDHEQETPLVGGIGIFVAFTFGALLLGLSLNPYRPLFAGMGLLLLVGLLDDLRDIGAGEKFMLQLVAGLILVLWGGLGIADLGRLPLLGVVTLGWAAIPFTLLCVVGLINAVNMLDGLDGLAGSVVLVMLFWLIVLAVGGADPAALALLLLLASAVAGFLVFNFPVPWRRCAGVFLGDSGTLMLGFAVAWFAIDIVFEQGLDVPPVVVAWIMILPVADTISLMLRRLMKGRNPMAADREHLHHIFLRAGFSATRTVHVAAGAAFVLGAFGVLGWKLGVPEWALWFLLLAVFLGHWLLVRHAWRAMRLLRRAHGAASVDRAG